MSNSLKFTVSGSVNIRTKLLLPLAPPVDDAPAPGQNPLPMHNGAPPHESPFHVDIEKNAAHTAAGDEPGSPQLMQRSSMAIIRIEVSDTGVGLRHQDMVE